MEGGGVSGKYDGGVRLRLKMMSLILMISGENFKQFDFKKLVLILL